MRGNNGALQQMLTENPAMGAAMQQVLALQADRAAHRLGEGRGDVQGGGAARVVGEQRAERGEEGGVGRGLLPGGLEGLEGGEEGFRPPYWSMECSKAHNHVRGGGGLWHVVGGALKAL